jgi:hypothetical protein
MGMIKLENTAQTIIAVERDGGMFYEVKDSLFERMKYNSGSWIATGRYATGALALWTNDPSGKMMLTAGIQGGLYNTVSVSYTHGYVEFYLTESGPNSGSLDTDKTRRDPPSVSIHGNTDRYTATLGKHPINHLFQATKKIDEKLTFFASTQNAGLWSYRNLGKDLGGWQWNAETD